MKKIERKRVNWEKTGKTLLLLRNDNIELRRNVCSALRYDEENCGGDCENCKYEMDSSISRAELARIFNVSENVIFNWETGKTPVAIEDLLFYCRLSGKELSDILIFED